MNTYYCHYKGGTPLEVHAETSYAAQLKALDILQKKYKRTKVKGYDIAVVLVEVDGTPVTHTAVD